MHRSFNRTRHVASTCTVMATWFLNWADTILPHKWHLDRFMRFCRTHSRDQHTDRQAVDTQTDNVTLPLATVLRAIRSTIH